MWQRLVLVRLSNSRNHGCSNQNQAPVERGELGEGEDGRAVARLFGRSALPCSGVGCLPAHGV